MALRLIIEDDEGTTTVVSLGTDAITIGRQQGNTIQLTEKNVSRRHARLFPETDDESWSIEDLGSYNGVKINGSAVEARNELKEGDVVQIGDYNLTLTENADNTVVSPVPTAANDLGARPEEPTLASSSNDLPRLSTEDLAALQSAPGSIHSPSHSPSQLGDSGVVPAIAGPAGAGGFEEEEEERKSSTGLLIGAGAVVVGVLVVAFAWMASSGNEEDLGATATVASSERPMVVEDPRAAMADVEPGVIQDAGIIEPEPAETAGVVEPEPIAVVDEPVKDPSEPTSPVNKKPRRKTNPRSGGQNKKTSPPSTPAKPAVDADALFKEAKKASFGKFAQCYDLAKKSHDASRSAQAANLMGVCACKMGNEGKAKRAVAKLRGAKKDNVVKLCASKGIVL